MPVQRQKKENQTCADNQQWAMDSWKHQTQEESPEGDLQEQAHKIITNPMCCPKAMDNISFMNIAPAYSYKFWSDIWQSTLISL